MTCRVFVTAASVKAPGVAAAADLAALVRGDRSSALEAIRVADEEIRLGEEIPVDRASPFYPTRSNEKIMRKEVVAATVGVCELLSGAGLPDDARADVPLFVASGVTMERQIGDVDWFGRAFEAAREPAGTAARNRRLGQVTPPLLALRTLTNATSSFVAEGTGVAGNNTTFGSTSNAGFHALRECVDAVRHGDVPVALAGGASRGGVASYLTFRSFFPDRADWRESLATAFLLLESEASMRSRGGSPLCEIIELAGTARPPSLMSPPASRPFEELADRGTSADMAVFSGAYCGAEYRALRDAAEADWPRAESLFETLGNCGAANVFLDILTGAALADGPAVVDCLDRDPYGRDCLVRIAGVAA